MTKINKHIEIVRSSKRSLSSMSLESCAMISDVLTKYYKKVGITTVNDSRDLDLLIIKKPDLVFLGVKKVPIIDGLNNLSDSQVWVSEYLDRHSQNYSGSTAISIALDYDKSKAKNVVRAAGHKTSDYFLAQEGQYADNDKLPVNFPLFLKPIDKGGGEGIAADSVVHNFGDFSRKVVSINSECKSTTLAEKYLTGREFSVAILEDIDSDSLIIMPIELLTDQNISGDRILGGDTKSANTEQAIKVHDLILRDKIMEFAEGIFKALGARDYGRIDVRLDSLGAPHFLEANLIPSLISGYGSFPKACMLNNDLDYEAMILYIVELGLSRDDNDIDVGLELNSGTRVPVLT